MPLPRSMNSLPTFGDKAVHTDSSNHPEQGSRDHQIDHNPAQSAPMSRQSERNYATLPMLIILEGSVGRLTMIILGNRSPCVVRQCKELLALQDSDLWGKSEGRCNSARPLLSDSMPSRRAQLKGSPVE